MKELLRRNTSPVFAAVVLAAAAVRIVPALSVLWVSNDAVEYLDIAKRLACGQGFTLSIKAYHFVPGPLIHYAGYDRAPLFPFLLAAVRLATANPHAPQILNLGLACLGAALGAALAWRVYGRGAALWAGLLLALAPPLVRASWYPWSEPLAFALVLGSILAFLGAGGWRGMALAGALSGAAFLARPACLYLPAVMAVFAAIGGGDWRRRLARLAALGAGFAALASVQAALNVAYGAPALTTAQSFLYRAVRFHVGMFSGYGQAWTGSAVETVRAHPREVAVEIYRHLRDYSRALFLGRDWLGLFVLALPLLALRGGRGARRRLGRDGLVILTVALAGFAFHVLSWPSKDTERFLQIPFALLLILAVGEADRFALQSAWLKKRMGRPDWIVPALALLMAALYLWPSIQTAREALRRRGTQWPMMGVFSANWKNPDARALHQWIESHTAPEAALASTCPWALAYHTGRPSVLLPFDMDREALRRFLGDFAVDFLIENPDYPHPVFQREADYGQALAELGAAPPERVGSYRVYDTRAARRGA